MHAVLGREIHDTAKLGDTGDLVKLVDSGDVIEPVLGAQNMGDPTIHYDGGLSIKLLTEGRVTIRAVRRLK